MMLLAEHSTEICNIRAENGEKFLNERNSERGQRKLASLLNNI